MILRYKLEKYKGAGSRHTCPRCKGKREFTRYIEISTGKELHPDVGKCNRIVKCGYHYTPKQFFASQRTFKPNYYVPKPKKIKTNPIYIKDISFIPDKMFIESKNNYEKNNFILFLRKKFDSKTIIEELIDKYNIGTSDKWKGSTIFWQKDIHGNIRTGKIMLYDPMTGKRVRKPYSHISWAHNNIKNFKLEQCLYGEHLLSKDIKIVCLTESEKTALIASIYHPDNVWLATGGISNLSLGQCRVLSGKRVVLFPDKGAYSIWWNKAMQIGKILPIKFIFCNILEDDTTIESGEDLADYLLKNKPGVSSVSNKYVGRFSD